VGWPYNEDDFSDAVVTARRITEEKDRPTFIYQTPGGWTVSLKRPPLNRAHITITPREGM
jgi:hypothetical protein